VALDAGTVLLHDCFHLRRPSFPRPNPYQAGFQDGYAKCLCEHEGDYARGVAAGRELERREMASS
jgi:hypothetical protein